jgi:hypothetical protein
LNTLPTQHPGQDLYILFIARKGPPSTAAL